MTCESLLSLAETEGHNNGTHDAHRIEGVCNVTCYLISWRNLVVERYVGVGKEMRVRRWIRGQEDDMVDFCVRRGLQSEIQISLETVDPGEISIEDGSCDWMRH
jgi:hypothetical protein